ncbi:MAG: hypothetical protein R3C14_51780 [Caldilineaceae bacterium]
MQRKQRKRLMGLGLMLIVVLGLVTAVNAAEARRTPDWQRALQQTLPAALVTQVVRAPHPAAFDPTVISAVLRRGQFAYRAHITADAQPILLNIATPGAPRTVYCVVAQTGVQARLLFINYYTDNLWRSDWMVLDGGVLPVTATVRTHLAALGCQAVVG